MNGIFGLAMASSFSFLFLHCERKENQTKTPQKTMEFRLISTPTKKGMTGFLFVLRTANSQQQNQSFVPRAKVLTAFFGLKMASFSEPLGANFSKNLESSALKRRDGKNFLFCASSLACCSSLLGFVCERSELPFC